MDLNGDGNIDILSGSYSGDDLPEMAGLFQVLWGKKGGGFRKPDPLKGTDGKFLIITPEKIGKTDPVTSRICTRPTAVDFDSDGDLDLVVGNFKGTFYWFEGEGKGKFKPESSRIDCGDKALKIPSYHSDPFFIDWDGDGDLDMLSGGAGGEVVWSENSAGKGKPISLGKFETLTTGTKNASRWVNENAFVGDSSRVWVDDLNGDGKLDLIVGDRVSLKSPLGGASWEEAKEQIKALDREFNELRDKLSKIPTKEARQERNKKRIEHYDNRRELMKEERTGFVWVYYQK
ncbi:MAG: VCBS repeat-containing protein [Verrucomicrobiaceae bacterium]|nr:VCBS repeat-containing protein [Verrucomicrobiaceae bacterium]